MVAVGCEWRDGKAIRAEIVPGSIMVWISTRKPPKCKHATGAALMSLESSKWTLQ